MQLKEWRALKGLNLEEVVTLVNDAAGKTVASNAGTVARHERGARVPDLDTMEAYRTITDGAVRYEDWVDLAKAKPTAAAQPHPTEVAA